MQVPLKLIADQSEEALSELLICRHLNGIKVINRPNGDTKHEHGKPRTPLISLQDAMHLPFNVFFHDIHHRVVQVNEVLWQHAGFSSRKDAVGIRCEDICRNKEQTLKIYTNDNLVLTNKSLRVFEEEATISEHGLINAVSYKMPWYDNDGRIAGLFGCSVMLHSNQPNGVAQQLAIMSNLFITNPSPIINMLPGGEFNHNYFTRREIDIIRLVVRGKTMRGIGMTLGLATRTIENYFYNIRIKIDAKTKSEFIEKMIDYFI